MHRFLIGLIIWFLSILPVTNNVHAQHSGTNQENRAGIERANALHDEMIRLFQDGRYEEAYVLGEQVVELRRTALGEKHPGYVKSLNNLGALYQFQGHYDKAEPLLVEAYEITRDFFEADHPDHAIALNNLAAFYVTQQRYGEAEPLHLQALKIRRKVFGEDHPDYISSLSNLAFLYYTDQRYAEAELRYKQAVEKIRRIKGTDDPDYVRNLTSLASVYELQGRNSEAERLYKEGVEITRQVQGVDDPDYAASVSDLASFYEDIGRYSEAERLYKEVIEITRKAWGTEDLNYTVAITNLASLYEEVGRYKEAERLYKEAIEIERQVLGLDDPEYGTTVNNLGLLYALQGRYDEAERLYREALEINRKVLGSEHPNYTAVINNLASLYDEKGLYRESERLYREVLEIEREILGADDPGYAVTVVNLATLYYSEGRFSEAERLYDEAIKIQRKALGPDHPDYAATVGNLALLYEDLGRYNDSERLYKEALKIERNVLGADHPRYAATVGNLALLYDILGRYNDSERLYKEALKIERKALGPDHPDYAITVGNLGLLYDSVRRYREAERLHEEAMEIKLNALGPNHPSYAASLGNLAFVLANPLAPGFDLNKGTALFLKEMEVRTRNITETMPGLAFSQQRDMLADLFVGGQGAPILSFAQSDEIVFEAYSHLFQWKGLLLHTLRRQADLIRLGQNPTYAEPVNQLQATRAELAGWFQRASDVQLNAWQVKNDSLSRVKESLEQQLASALPADAFADPLAEIGLEGFQQLLGPRQAFLDIRRHNFWKNGEVLEDRYSAVLTSGSQPVKLIHLGAAAAIDSLLMSWRDEVNQERSGEEPWSELVRLLWRPVVSALPDDLDGLWVSPDGMLARLPWNLLPISTDQTTNLPISMIGSARELLPLLRREDDVLGGGSLLLVGDLDFDAYQSKTTHYMPQYKPLEGTADEVEAIGVLAQARDVPVTMLRQSEGTVNAVVEAMPGSRYVHLATHGFFYGENMEVYAHRTRANRFARRGNRTPRSNRNPLVESGIALSGANVRDSLTFRPYGLLTAEEMLGLDLRNTELVVLSACDTGRGTEVTGQGVMGLQAAIMTAGVESLLMSLWKVPDAPTALLMEVFYEKLWDKGLEKGEALRAAQEVVKERYPRPVYWAAWTLAGKAW